MKQRGMDVTLDLDGTARSRLNAFPLISWGQDTNGSESVVFEARRVLSSVDSDAHSEDAMITLFFRSLANDADEVKRSVHHGRNGVDIVIIGRASTERE